MPDLDRLAVLVDELAADHPRTSLPLLVWCRGPLADAEIELLPLDGAHPSTVLLGALAPPDAAAVGTVTTGWSVPPADEGSFDLRRNRRIGVPAGAHPERRAVRSTVLVGADGSVAGRLAVDGADAVPAAPSAGALLDLLRRTLGCATEPPGVPLVELLACAWLAQVATLDPGATWSEVAEVHLAMQVCPARTADDLVEVAVDVACRLGWAGMRRVVRAGGWPAVCGAELAAWLDDGSFARWTLGSFPPLADLVVAAVAGRPPTVTEAVRAAVRGWRLG